MEATKGQKEREGARLYRTDHPILVMKGRGQEGRQKGRSRRTNRVSGAQLGMMGGEERVLKKEEKTGFLKRRLTAADTGLAPCSPSRNRGTPTQKYYNVRGMGRQPRRRRPPWSKKKGRKEGYQGPFKAGRAKGNMTRGRSRVSQGHRKRRAEKDLLN